MRRGRSSSTFAVAAVRRRSGRMMRRAVARAMRVEAPRMPRIAAIVPSMFRTALFAAADAWSFERVHKALRRSLRAAISWSDWVRKSVMDLPQAAGRADADLLASALEGLEVGDRRTEVGKHE